MLISRAGKQVLRTFQQEHSFGCPFQLGHHDLSSQPADAWTSTVHLAEGDVIVVGTDGLFDNVPDGDIIQVADEAVAKFAAKAKPGESKLKLAQRMKAASSEAARELVTKAFHHSMDKKYASPYAIAAQEEFDMIFSGGKKDDCSVVVAVVVGNEHHDSDAGS